MQFPLDKHVSWKFIVKVDWSSKQDGLIAFCVRDKSADPTTKVTYWV